MLNDKVILVTGGTGSFGQKFAEIALREFNPKALRIFSRGEYLQEQMGQRFGDDPRLRFFIGDVRDKERVQRAMNGVDIVIHAAALKQVPTCEYNPIEAVRTNVEGAISVVNAAIDNGVKHLLAISTDKAVQPVNLYGATKLVMERVVVQANVYTSGRTRLSCTRYGNVIGSRGSVVPLFLKQRETGEITITDEHMTRFWITMEQGVRFVIGCIGNMRGGEIFVPKMPSMRVSDIADVVAPEAKRKIIGIRPGEKLHEMLLVPEEARHAVEFDNYLIIEPEHSYWSADPLDGGRPVPADFAYRSDSNQQWLGADELRAMMKEI
jgi:UDP-N-acetylglucosamine 4,6-dehydratase